MIKIIQDYQDWRKACKTTKKAVKDLQDYSSFICAEKIRELEINGSSYSIEKFSCKAVQRFFYCDNEYCVKCPHYKEFGSYKDMATKVYEAREKQRHAKIRLVNNLRFWKTK